MLSKSNLDFIPNENIISRAPPGGNLNWIHSQSNINPVKIGYKLLRNDDILHARILLFCFAGYWLLFSFEDHLEYQDPKMKSLVSLICSIRLKCPFLLKQGCLWGFKHQILHTKHFVYICYESKTPHRSAYSQFKPQMAYI